MPRVDWHQDAIDDLMRLSLRQPRDGRLVWKSTTDFARSGHGDLRKLTGTRSEWRLRVGDWRVLLELRGDGSYYVKRVVNRRDAYD